MKEAVQDRPSFRLNHEDVKILGKLQAKLGVKVSQIFRIALRALADKEGIRY
jgi:hypothetical protein